MVFELGVRAACEDDVGVARVEHRSSVERRRRLDVVRLPDPVAQQPRGRGAAGCELLERALRGDEVRRELRLRGRRRMGGVRSRRTIVRWIHRSAGNKQRDDEFPRRVRARAPSSTAAVSAAARTRPRARRRAEGPRRISPRANRGAASWARRAARRDCGDEAAGRRCSFTPAPCASSKTTAGARNLGTLRDLPHTAPETSRVITTRRARDAEASRRAGGRDV